MGAGESSGERAEARWNEGLPSEETFWRRYLTTGGDLWPEDFKQRLQPRPLDHLELECVRRIPHDVIRILDVGAGPLTVLGSTHPTKTIEIVAVDPLAPRYDELLAEAAIDPPVRTQFCHGEKLLDTFSRESFDITHMRNALDHTYDPISVINNMLAVVRPGGFVILRHWVNEGERESYQGLHQWNLDAAGGRIVVWRPGEQPRDVGRELAAPADVWVRKSDDWLTCVLRKSQLSSPLLNPIDRFRGAWFRWSFNRRTSTAAASSAAGTETSS